MKLSPEEYPRGHPECAVRAVLAGLVLGEGHGQACLFELTVSN